MAAEILVTMAGGGNYKPRKCRKIVLNANGCMDILPPGEAGELNPARVIVLFPEDYPVEISLKEGV